MINSKLIIGTAQFGLNYGINNNKGQLSETEIFKILDFSHERGLITLDTAPGYGKSEEIIGKYFLNNKDKKFQIISKLNINNNGFKKSLISSLEKLKIEYIDTLLFHSFDQYTYYKNRLNEFNRKFRKNLYGKIGVSLYTRKEVEDVLLDDEIDLIQAPFNLIDNESIRGELYRKIKKSGKELHTRSVFLQGIFFKPFNELPLKLRPLIKPLNKINKLCYEHKISKNELSICYCISKDYVDKVLIGVDGLKHLDENYNSQFKTLNKLIYKKIDALTFSKTKLLNPSLW